MVNKENKLKIINGIKKMKAAGESEQNIKRFVDIAKSRFDKKDAGLLPKQNTMTSISKPGTFIEGAKSLFEGKKLITDPVETLRHPGATGQAGLQALQTAGQFGAMGIGAMAGVNPAVSRYLSAPLTGITEAGIQGIKGKSFKESMKRGGIAALGDLASEGIVHGGGKLIRKIFPGTVKALAGIPKEASEIALNQEKAGKSLFNESIADKEVFTKMGANVQEGFNNILNENKKIYDALGKKAEEGLNKLTKDAAKKVSAAQQSLKGTDLKVNTERLINSIKNDIDYITFDKVNALTSRDKQSVATIIKKLKPKKSKILDISGKTFQGKDINLEKLEGIKEKAQSLVDYTGQGSDKGNNLLLGIAAKVRKEIHSNLPSNLKDEYLKSHLLFEKIAPIKKELKNLVKKEGGIGLKKFIEKSGKNLDEIAVNSSSLKNLDEILPNKYKFMKDLINTSEHQKSITPRTLLKGDPAEIGGNLKKIIKDSLGNPEVIKNEPALIKLDKALPEQYKFMDKLKKNTSRQFFEEWLPQKGVLHNIRLAGAIGLGGYGAGRGDKKLMAGAALLGGIGSPKVHKNLLRAGYSPLQKVVKGASKAGITKTQARIMDLLNVGER